VKFRIIPTLLTDGKTIVKGTKFNNWRTVGMVEAAAKLYSKRDVDELVLLDVMASQRDTLIPDSFISSFTRELNVPFTIGGGIKNMKVAARYLNMGAEKIVIGSAAINNPQIITDIAERFGSQAVVVAVDIIDLDCNQIAVNCGKEKINVNVIEFVKKLQNLGVGEILLQSVKHDGEMSGMNYAAISKVASAVNLPIIASGGAGSFIDCANALKSGASAVAIGALFQFSEITPKDVREYLEKIGFKTRVS